MTDDSIAVSTPRISMAELDGIHRHFRTSPKSPTPRHENLRETDSGLTVQYKTIELLGEHLKQCSFQTVLSGLPSVSSSTSVSFVGTASYEIVNVVLQRSLQ